jgi:hypothetical protein
MPAHSDRLRVGVLLDSFVVPKWIHSILEEIQNGDDGRIELVVLNTARPAPRTWRSRLQNRGTLPFALYSRVDKALFARRGGEDDAFAEIDSSGLLRDVSVREVAPQMKRWTDRFSDADVEAIRNEKLDVVLRFGFRILKGPILEAARYGVWSFHHDDNRLYRGGPALFWEMYEGNPLSGTVLQILSETLDGGKILYRSTSATNLISFYRNRNATYWKTARFVGRRLRDLRRLGLDSLVETGSDTMPYTRGIYRLPGPAAMTRFLARTAWRNVKTQLRNRFGRDQWFIAYAERPRRLLEARPRFTIIDSPADHFYADPFIVEQDGMAWLFIEDYPYATTKGVISCIELRDGKTSPTRVVLERDYHLSYPAVFSWNGQWFMTPETEQNQSVELYRAVAFPWTWELDTVLLRGVRAVDPTIFRHGDRFWMFATVAPHGASMQDEVSLFFADSIRGPWHSHPSNPVVSDVRSARPAGRPFVEEGVLYRPGQNCAVCYGQSMTINRVDVMTETEYRETPVTTIPPTWLPDSLGTHTLNSSENWVVTDGKRWRWSLKK